MRQIEYVGPAHDATLFVEDGDHIWLRRLCGLTCGNDGEDTGPAMTQGMAILVTSLGRFEGSKFSVLESAFDAQTARIVWSAAQGALRWESTWLLCPQTGVVSRKDRLINTGNDVVTVFRLQARFAFPPGRHEVYAQNSQWCNENQGAWIGLHAGSLRFGCVQGRTTQGGSPYLCLREVGADRGLAFHVLPCGNWSIEVAARAVMDNHPFAIVTLGLASDDLHLKLLPGASVQCPEILIQSLPDGQPQKAAPRLHQWLHERLFALQRPELPVVYNTWFDQYEVLDVPRLRQQLQTAKEIGCEVFVVDAGWYGPQTGDWLNQAGDWREKTDSAFCGAMAAFADEVRAAGLGFGLWMEPERFGPDVPIRQEHPDWFHPGQPPFARIDLENPAAYDYLRHEISRLVTTYHLAWMKVDFNFELGIDVSGAELLGYYEAWHRLLDEIRSKHPATIFEGCASGGMRLDLASLKHFDGHFLTDTVNPIDVVRIWQGALLRLPPGQLTLWAVTRSVGQTIPRYAKSLADSSVSIVTPCGAFWEPSSETAEVDFVAATALPGVFGLGGDLAGLPKEVRSRLREHVAFWKQWRRAIRHSVAHLLTPLASKKDRGGWVAVQLNDHESGTAFLFVYRLNDGSAAPSDTSSAKRFYLRELDPEATYDVIQHTPPGEPSQSVGGAELVSEGIEVALPSRRQAAAFVLKQSHRN